jgi:hypothetical protein
VIFEFVENRLATCTLPMVYHITLVFFPVM